MFWPSFNGALSPTDEQYRAVINTYISLAACCVVTFAISALVSKEGKFEMVCIDDFDTKFANVCMLCVYCRFIFKMPV